MPLPAAASPADPVSAFMVALADAAFAEVGLGYARQAATGSIATESKGEKGGRLDVVTIADKEIQAYVESRVRAQFPGEDFLGEESESDTSTGSSARWVLDPIDGTGAFKTGDPNWACCVLARQVQVDGSWKTTHAVTGEPMNGRLFYADASGAYVHYPAFFGDADFHSIPNMRGRWSASGSLKAAPHENMTIEFRLVGHEAAEERFRSAARQGVKCTFRSQGAIANTLARAALITPGTYAIVCGGIDLWDWAAPVHILEQIGFQWESVSYPAHPNKKTGKPYEILYVAEDPAALAHLKTLTERSL